MIIVTGATGQLGSTIVKRLIERIPAEQVGASVRSVEKAADLAASGVRVRHGDFGEPETLAHSFEGATQILMVSSNARAFGGDAIAQHKSAIAAAREAGVERIVYTSHMGASATSAFSPMLDHAATEKLLAQSGLKWTSLRNGFYAESGVDLLGDAPTTGELKAAADGKVSWTNRDDLAEAAAIVLTQAGRFEGPTPALTNVESLDIADITRIASEIVKRPIARTVLSDEEMRATMSTRGLPSGVIDIVLGLYIASRNGEFAKVDPTLEQLVGRKPISMKQMIVEKLSQ